jgi:hypothetical protein
MDRIRKGYLRLNPTRPKLIKIRIRTASFYWYKNSRRRNISWSSRIILIYLLICLLVSFIQKLSIFIKSLTNQIINPVLIKLEALLIKAFNRLSIYIYLYIYITKIKWIILTEYDKLFIGANSNSCIVCVNWRSIAQEIWTLRFYICVSHWYYCHYLLECFTLCALFPLNYLSQLAI